jgi:hypothetical protein
VVWDALFLIATDDYTVAHWAHLGGFAAGFVIAIGMLLTRGVDAHGGDLLSAMLGRRAWVLLGKPAGRQSTHLATR